VFDEGDVAPLHHRAEINMHALTVETTRTSRIRCCQMWQPAHMFASMKAMTPAAVALYREYFLSYSRKQFTIISRCLGVAIESMCWTASRIRRDKVVFKSIESRPILCCHGVCQPCRKLDDAQLNVTCSALTLYNSRCLN
jgi:hypothetical protein